MHLLCKKNYQHSEQMTESIFAATHTYISENPKRRISVGGVLNHLGVESFHALIKREWLNRFVIRDIEHAHTLVFEYINSFYNTRRTHSFCGYESPLHFEAQYYRNRAEAKEHTA